MKLFVYYYYYYYCLNSKFKYILNHFKHEYYNLQYYALIWVNYF